jgi:hypothetical protein
VKPDIVKILDEKEGALMEVSLIDEHAFPLLLLGDGALYQGELLVLCLPQPKLVEVVGKLAALVLHDAESSEVEATEGCFFEMFMFLQVLGQFVLVHRVPQPNYSVFD